MTDFNNRRKSEQCAASESHHDEADDTHYQDSTDSLDLLLLPDGDDDDLNPNPDDHDAREHLRPSTTTKIITMAVVIVAVLLLGFVVVEGARALANIAATVVSCIHICCERGRAMIEAAIDRAHRHAVESEARMDALLENHRAPIDDFSARMDEFRARMHDYQARMDNSWAGRNRNHDGNPLGGFGAGLYDTEADLEDIGALFELLAWWVICKHQRG